MSVGPGWARDPACLIGSQAAGPSAQGGERSQDWSGGGGAARGEGEAEAGSLQVLTLHLTLRLRVKGSGVVQGGPRVGCGGWVVWADPHGCSPQLLQLTEPLGKRQAPRLGLII